MQAKLPIVYASTSGNVEFTCESAAAVWEERGISCQLLRAEVAPVKVLADNVIFVLATSTWEHGVLNPFFQPWVEYMQTHSMAGKKALMIGLGDMRYERFLFNQGYKHLLSFFTEAGGIQIGKPLLLNGQPYDQLEQRIIPWAESEATELSDLLADPARVAQLPAKQTSTTTQSHRT